MKCSTEQTRMTFTNYTNYRVVQTLNSVGFKRAIGRMVKSNQHKDSLP